MLDKIIKTFVLYVSFLSLRLKIKIYLTRKIQITLLLAKEVIIWSEYSDFANIFFKKSAKILPERIKINKYTIKWVDSKQPL